MSSFKKTLLVSTLSIAALTGMAHASDLSCTVAGGDDITMANIDILRSNEPVVNIDGYKSPILSNIYRIDAVDGQDISETPTYLLYNHYPLADHKLYAKVQVHGEEAVTGYCIVTGEI
ncbi:MULTISPECIES: hypothetical protein [unclassified Shewanella]|uniref:hypothetical protein n=1 Tax=unclassified Shewanella TaxID=196818 RepID=UPI000C82D46B|nr:MULTISPECIES: hypothetical protein [unclassified Shewanella]MDO6619477.1 hypothetical protein [Shewanella sp. 6_MG-2023]MDO6639431.1 hypothetical protein [Shewanella sp. 5_MG-2023]MDO6678192.1 hypothetical protein [Shewanella sp. 4_MG-2023]MDO6775931.1 hypothetical protein [Shewanella sp. 3_MG-2023]PMG30286.1 hypothetical protein BCU94_11865 [Shewanella sp. 10N.286.52.C2]